MLLKQPPEPHSVTLIKEAVNFSKMSEHTTNTHGMMTGMTSEIPNFLTT